jgi:hypothetical protein
MAVEVFTAYVQACAEIRDMSIMSGVLLPYDPQYVGHRQAEKRRRETGEWLRQQELRLLEPNQRQQSPSIVPQCAPEEKA